MTTAYRCRKCGTAFLYEQPRNVIFPQVVTDVLCPNCNALQGDDDKSHIVEPTKGRFTTQGRENDGHTD